MTQRSKLVPIQTVTLTDNSRHQIKIPSTGFITDLYIRLTATTTGGSPTGPTLDNVLALLDLIQLDVNSRQLLNIPGDVLARWNYFTNRTVPRNLFATTTPGAIRGDYHIPLSLQKPWRSSPMALLTGIPAGVVDTITLTLQAAPDLIAALYSSVSTTSFSAGPTLQIYARVIEQSPAELLSSLRAKQVKANLLLYREVALSAVGQFDVLLDSSPALMPTIYSRIINNGAGSDALVTTTRVTLGNNDNVLDSNHLDLVQVAQDEYELGGSDGTTDDRPAGAYLFNFCPFNNLDNAIPMIGKQDSRVTFNVASSPTSAKAEVVQQTVQDGFWENVVGPSRLAA